VLRGDIRFAPLTLTTLRKQAQALEILKFKSSSGISFENKGKYAGKSDSIKVQVEFNKVPNLPSLTGCF